MTLASDARARLSAASLLIFSMALGAGCSSADAAPISEPPAEDGTREPAAARPSGDAGHVEVDAAGDAGLSACASGAAPALATVRASIYEASAGAVPSEGFYVIARRAIQDPSGAWIVAGHVRGAFTLGGHSLAEVGRADIADLFVAKIEPSGSVAWAIRPSEGGDYAFERAAADVAVDAQGNVYVAGSFWGSATFGSSSIASTGTPRGFVTELDPAGQWKWTRTFDSAGSRNVNVTRVALTRDERRIAVGGWFQGSVRIGGVDYTAPDGASDAFVASIDAADGEVLWGKAFGAPGVQSIDALAVDAHDAIVFAGRNTGRADFGGGAIGSAAGADTVLFVKLDGQGSHLFSKAFGADHVSLRSGNGVQIDPCDDAIVLTGSVSGSVDFGGGPTAGQSSLFVARYATDGALAWAQRFEATKTWTDTRNPYAAGNDVAIDASGHVVVVGEVVGEINVGGAKMGDPASAFASTAVLLSLDRSGAVKQATSIPGARALTAAAFGRGTFIVGGDAQNGTTDLGLGAVTVGSGAGWWTVLTPK